MITKADFNTLTTKIDEVVNETAKASIAEMVGGKLFEESMTDMFTYDKLILHALPGMRRKAEGQQFPRVTGVEGDSISYTQREFGVTVAVTKTMRKFDRYDQIEGLVKTTVDSSFSDIDQSYADVLLNGWATSYTDIWGDTVSGAGPDGLALFSTAHTNNLTSRTFRNQIKNSAAVENPAMSYDAIVTARKDARVYKDPQGKNRPIRLNTLVVSPTNEDAAYRLVNSTNLPGGPDNDLNFLKGQINEVVVWEKLETRSDATDTKAYWFLADSAKVKTSLVAKYAQKPTMQAPEVVHDTQDWDYVLDAYYALGLGFPAYIWGSNATLS
jgi:hypothetical protein